MSLLCAGCIGYIETSFGMLYQLSRNLDGKQPNTLKYPDKTKDYVPANVAVCKTCWKCVPSTEYISLETALAEGGDHIYGYTSATSSYDSGGTAQWSGIESSYKDWIYVRYSSLVRSLPNVPSVLHNDFQAKIVSKMLGALNFDVLSNKDRTSSLVIRAENTYPNLSKKASIDPVTAVIAINGQIQHADASSLWEARQNLNHIIKNLLWNVLE